MSTFGHSALSWWGAPDGSSVGQYALEYLQIRALGSPATAALLVSQVKPVVGTDGCYAYCKFPFAFTRAFKTHR
jgi:hypothetical protein